VAAHFGEWGYLAEREDGTGHQLLGTLMAAKQIAEAKSLRAGGEVDSAPATPPPGLKPPVNFSIDVTSKAAQFTTHTPVADKRGPVAIWAEENGLGVLVEILAMNDLNTVGELGALAEIDIDAMFTAEPSIPAGPRARFRVLVREMRVRESRRAVEEVGSGWFVVETGVELPVSATCGAGLGGPEMLVLADPSKAVIALPDQGLVEITRKGLGSSPRAREEPESAGREVVPEPACQGFRQGGPLKELATAAAALLSRVEGTDATHMERPSKVVGSKPAWSESGPVEASRGTRLSMGPGQRAEGRPVALKVDKSHAAAVYEEWTNAGTVRLQEAVASRTWKSVEAKRGAYSMARSLDVMVDSGLDVCKEPSAEVLLRAIVADWYADRHPKDHETAEYLKESSMSHFGVPRGMLEEARAMRKLLTKAASEEAT